MVNNIDSVHYIMINYVMVVFSITEDDVQKVVSLCVDGKESRIIFIDHKHTEMSVSNIIR